MNLGKLLVCTSVCLSIMTGTFAGPSAQKLSKRYYKRNSSGAESPGKTDQWMEKRARLLEEIRVLKQKKQWLDYEKQKHAVYIEKQKQAIEQLVHQQKETEKIKMELAPFLDDLYEKLKNFVASDLPFLKDERKKRLDFLENSLNSHELSLDEKARRSLEALLVEAGYGFDCETIRDTIILNGKKVQADVLRIGRTALFCRAADNSYAGWFNLKTGLWEAISSAHAKDIKKASEKQQNPELIYLPVETPKEAF